MRPVRTCIAGRGDWKPLGKAGCSRAFVPIPALRTAARGKDRLVERSIYGPGATGCRRAHEGSDRLRVGQRLAVAQSHALERRCRHRKREHFFRGPAFQHRVNQRPSEDISRARCVHCIDCEGRQFNVRLGRSQGGSGGSAGDRGGARLPIGARCLDERPACQDTSRENAAARSRCRRAAEAQTSPAWANRRPGRRARRAS